MEMPNVKNEIFDERINVKFEIMAYRELSYEEMVSVVQTYLANPRKKDRPKRGGIVRIETTID
jgi:hypothetical protein